MAECQDNLTTAEVERNIHGPMFSYEYSSANFGILNAQYGLSTVNKLQCKETPIYRNEVSRVSRTS